MATQIVQDSATQAMTEWCDDQEWARRDDALPVGVWRRLQIVNRALYAINAIAEMLARDRRGKSDAEANEGVIYQGLNVCDAEALEIAMIELGSRAEEVLVEVRDDRYGCCGTSRASSGQEAQL